MVLLEPKIGATLSFEEVKHLVEASSPGIELQVDDDKGRFLVAKKAFKAGEVILSEFPIFYGRTDGAQSRKACREEFLSLTNADGHCDADYEEEDCMHPCSPLMDCLSGIILTKSEALNSKDKGDRATAILQIRKLEALASTSLVEPMSDEATDEIIAQFLPELKGSVDKDDIRRVLRIVSSNRFCGIEGQLDLMFAGSMFEHSCDPNCFAGNWRRTACMSRLYRASRDIDVGEALSISYIQLPELYLPFAGRSEILAPWGFQCSCPRCASLPELTRAFICPACSSSELCFLHPNTRELKCRKCEHQADDEYTTRCLKLEAILDRLADGVDEVLPTGCDNNLIGNFHYAAFRVSWQTMLEGPSPESLDRYACAIEDIIESISRLCGDPRNPHVLELYHIMAELETGNIENQQHFLDLERATLMYHYPELAEKQDLEIWNLVQGRGPHSTKQENVTDLSGMD
jgi:hypothetical protein